VRPIVLFNQILIVGVGLIGGSIGLDVQRKKLAKKVVGCGRTQHNLNIALKRGIIDEATSHLEEVIEGSDCILLCTPVKSLEQQIPLLAQRASKGTLVMDVGSTKEDIVRLAEKHFQDGISFIGAHPLAGTEKSGALGAEEHLFDGARCILTPASGVSNKMIGVAHRFWESLGMVVQNMDPREHDRALAATSHLPHMAAYALMSVIGKTLDINEISKFAGGGLKDTTRIAASPAEMWRDICLDNSKPLVSVLKKYHSEIEKLFTMIEGSESDKLLKYFDQISNLRRQLNK